MSIVNYFDNFDRKAGKEHFQYLIHVARADGVIGESELKLLYRIGKRIGLTDPEIDDLLKSKEVKIYTPPYELEKRFHLLYNVVSIALADGVLYDNEIRMIKLLAVASSFNDADAERLLNLLVNGIKFGKNEEELLIAFKQNKLKD